MKANSFGRFRGNLSRFPIRNSSAVIAMHNILVCLENGRGVPFELFPLAETVEHHAMVQYTRLYGQE